MGREKQRAKSPPRVAWEVDLPVALPRMAMANADPVSIAPQGQGASAGRGEAALATVQS